MRGRTADDPLQPIDAADPIDGSRSGTPTDGGGLSATNDLRDVTFVVFDLETTGMAPTTCAITEVGAVRFRSGERLGTLQTLVDPGVPVPALVRELTGISDATVAGSPSIASVLPSFLEFVQGAVLVAHNLRFDRAFLDHALEEHGYAPLVGPFVDTLALARHLVGDELPSHRLSMLARYLRARHRPRHRALDDALATADVFHALLERAATFDVTTLAALLDFPRSAAAERPRSGQAEVP